LTLFIKITPWLLGERKHKAPSLTDLIIKQCPYCGHEASIKDFGTWEREGKQGLLGKTPEGFIMFLCPQCEEIIKYDPVSDEFFQDR